MSGLIFNTVDLATTNGFTVTNVEGRTAADVDNRVVALPLRYRDVDLLSSQSLAEATATRMLTVDGFITGTSRSDLLTKVNTLLKALRSAGYAYLVFPDQSGYGYRCRFITSNEGDLVPGASSEMDLQLTFQCIPAYPEDVTAPTATTGLVVDNTGFLRAYPVITATMTDNHASLALTVNGRTMTVTTTLSTNDVLIFDCVNYTITLNGANAIAYHSGSFLYLEPGSQTATVAPTNHATFSWSFRRRYFI